MGIPYSKEVHSAFDQVTPLVAAGFDVLKTTKNIAILLAVIQVFITILLSLVFLGLLGVIYSINPDLEYERQELVTPFMRWLASWVLIYGGTVNWGMKVFVVLATAFLGVFLWQGSISGYIPKTNPEDFIEDEDAKDED